MSDRKTLAELLRFRIEEAEGKGGFVKIGLTMARAILEILRIYEEET